MQIKISGRPYHIFGLDGYRAFKADLQANPMNPRTNPIIVIDADFDGEKAINFLGLLAKTWHHILFVSGRGGNGEAAFRNPWKDYKKLGEELFRHDYFETRCPYLSMTREDGRYQFIISTLKAGVPVDVICALALRLGNMADWVSKYTESVWLTSDTPLRWATFNDISAHCRKAIESNPEKNGKRKALVPAGAPGPTDADAPEEAWGVVDEDQELPDDGEDTE